MKLLKDYIILLRVSKILSVTYAKNKNLIKKNVINDLSSKITQQMKLYKATNLLESLFDMNVVNDIIEKHSDMFLNTNISLLTQTKPCDIIDYRIPVKGDVNLKTKKYMSPFELLNEAKPYELENGLISDKNTNTLWNLVHRTNMNKIICAIFLCELSDNALSCYINDDVTIMYNINFVDRFTQHINKLLRPEYKCSIKWQKLIKKEKYYALYKNNQKTYLLLNRYDNFKRIQYLLTEINIEFKKDKSTQPLALALTWYENNLYSLRDII